MVVWQSLEAAEAGRGVNGIFPEHDLDFPAMVRSINEKEDEGCFDCMKDSPNVGPQMMFGWSWLFDSGANVAFAFGAFRPMNDGKTQDDVEPAGYFRIGYAY